MTTAGLRILVVATVLASLGLGVIAHRVSRRSAQDELGGPAPAHASAVVARLRLAAGAPIPADSLVLARVEIPPAGGFTVLSDVVGKMPSEEIDVGEPVLAKHFSEASRIARALQPGERAVAVRVDGVTGLGGFVAPGDSVDVLFFARRDGREIPDTQARVLLEGARVLAFGTRLESKGPEPETNARTAVLAVREKDAASLLLADAAGTLRLCLHQASDSGPESAGPVVTLEEITGRRAAPTRAPRADAFPIERGFE